MVVFFPVLPAKDFCLQETGEELAEKAGVSTKTVCNAFRYPDTVRKKRF